MWSLRCITHMQRIMMWSLSYWRNTTTKQSQWVWISALNRFKSSKQCLICVLLVQWSCTEVMRRANTDRISQECTAWCWRETEYLQASGRRQVWWDRLTSCCIRGRRQSQFVMSTEFLQQPPQLEMPVRMTLILCHLSCSHYDQVLISC